MKRKYLITFYLEKKVIRFLQIILEYFPIGSGLVTIFKCLDRFLEHVIIYWEILISSS
jgi:hypothetical protein